MFNFEGKEYSTIGDLLDGAIDAMNNGKAAEYLAAYRAVNEHADANLGYVFRYCDDDTYSKLRNTYQLTHPIFG